MDIRRPNVIKYLHTLLVSCWEKGTLPKDFRDAVIITLFKNKGSKSDCTNYRGITLLSIAGKILSRILLDRLTLHVSKEVLPESQCGFRYNRGTSDMIFTLRQIQEKCLEQNIGLFVTFVDLTKAFDTVSRPALWQLLETLGYPPKYLQMVIQLHDKQLGSVRIGAELSDPFQIHNGVKQGCVLAPTLFSIFFSAMVEKAFENKDPSELVYIRTRFDGSIFNIRRLKSHSLVTLKLVRDLLFADDAALIAHSATALQRLTDSFDKATKLFGLVVSLEKTVVLHQQIPNNPSTRSDIHIGETKLKNVKTFPYLGSIISNDAKIDAEIDNRLAKANKAFGKLIKRVWRNKDLKKATKIKIYKTIILPTLLYGAESWVLHRRHLRSLESFHQRCLRNILKIRWFHRVTNNEVLARSRLTNLQALLHKTQLRWAGHVSRMPDHRLPKAVMFGELESGKRTRGAPRKTYRAQLKKTIGTCNINLCNWTHDASDRGKWRKLIFKATLLADSRKIKEGNKRRLQRKAIN